MKKIYSLLLLLFFCISFSQVNVEEIKKNVTENPQKFYYEYLEVFKKSPETLSQEQLNYIYYGNNYVDYGYNRLEFNQELGKITKVANKNFSKKLAEITIEKALVLYEKNPI